MKMKKEKKFATRKRFYFFLAAVSLAAVLVVGGYTLAPKWAKATYERELGTGELRGTHLPTPEAVRGIYITSCVASAKTIREKILKEIEGTAINSIVIDVKDYSGRISIPTEDPTLVTKDSKGCFVKDMEQFVAELHEKGYYVIGRISVFQDPVYAKLHPELAVQKKDGSVWKDRKGLAFIDVSARPFWDYIVKIGKESYNLGFDELNFDYMRFPTDGDMKDINFPWTLDMEKKEALRQFFGYLHKQFRDSKAVLSVDFFGMTTTDTGDMNIGQYLEFALPYFDYIAPMVYPSHYPPSWNGLANPAANPYEVVKYSMERAYMRASSTPHKLRPWLQDFNLGATYTADMVMAQMKAVYDSGLTSWMLWSPSNKYTAGALNFAK
ncbi:MAG: hypothetical protein A3H57_01120 [Candidatus Taylorbacteria bacterium RIFCSPLOWO2_02_FULL_43_11]|uniref:DUF4015 domain-containing protein n=1 Tax=Candidatus Taylorbacteria bacterium RIFCSPHIGHO2_02_FULL_43_32b TaxID=1802306 RepID=A0A1G2MJM0_9BACT|nr:MAG: hypothetical protein A2743_01815 [Candidatus Taylorbacteria bacterium RIFCSPHIGHO2_01_FULL_43_47]OHA23369.1 MAG: hypothetical protein A3C72_00355 [Candidatus Taylorbacteria bacterium RIFCSPHIGHO2_02_FULL_43_32b]OHA36258.1 MAG: hypothetical protein A3H57_01120 [Candidatus Taylorbacteria bacterium RIFCSPLOWO2_02_FULL_43_11]